MGRDESPGISRERYKWVGGEEMAGGAPAVAPAAPPPVPCTYCGGPIGADETHCPECGAVAVRTDTLRAEVTRWR